MVLANHIAYRFLTDDNLIMEIIESVFPDTIKNFNDKDGVSDEVMSLYCALVPKDQKAYYITKTVLDKLDMLKLTKTGEHYNWAVFKNVTNRKVTFIFPDNKLLRMNVFNDTISFTHIGFDFTDKKEGTGKMKQVMFYLNRITGELCEHFEHQDVKRIETFIYSLLCFFYLTENEEIEIPAGRKYGTKKSPDNVLNSLNVPITIVNNRWNITTIRTDGFPVRGHFRIQPCGENLSDWKLIFIEPFEKNGYIRQAQKGLDNM